MWEVKKDNFVTFGKHGLVCFQFFNLAKLNFYNVDTNAPLIFSFNSWQERNIFKM